MTLLRSSVSGVLELLDASVVRRWATAATAALDRDRAAIDALNVYPVPDGDTGTNLSLTMRSAHDAVLTDRSAGAGAVLRAMARGAVLGARGNSGVILAQILRGIADATDADEISAAGLTKALDNAVALAYTAVAEPVEGTILSVAGAAANSARHQVGQAPDDVVALVRAVGAAAHEALDRTTSQLPALADAGVVDAGGMGLVVVLDALAAVLGEGEEADVSPADSHASHAREPQPTAARPPLVGPRTDGTDAYSYEVQYLLHADEAAMNTVKATLAALGDSLVIVGTGEDVWNVHVHVDDVGAAIEAGIEAGRPHRITVMRFADQAGPAHASASGGSASNAGLRSDAVAIVTVAPGPGLADVFRDEGVHVVEGGPSANPSTGEVLDAIVATGAGSVILLPNAAQVGGVAESAAAEARGRGIIVAVVPTRSPVQGLAAVAVHDESRRFEDDVITMAEAAAATRWAEVTVAARDALTMAGPCRAGDVLGLIGGEVVEIGADVGAVGLAVLTRLLGVGGELVTILVGAEAEPSVEQGLTAELKRMAPHVELSVFAGGQPHYPLLIGVE